MKCAGMDTAPRSYAEIERSAAVLRGIIAPAPGRLPALTLLESLEKLGCRVNDQVLPVTFEVDEIHPIACTYFAPEEGRFVVAVSESTYKALERDKPRARFSLGHELGHLALHRGELQRIASQRPVMARSSTRAPDHPCYRDTEWQANAFAAAFIAPASQIDQLSELSVSTLVECFGMSRMAASRRLALFLARREDLLQK